MSLRLAEIFLQLVRSLSFNSKESEVLGCWAGVLPSLREQLLPLTQQFSSYLSLCVCLRRWMAPGIMELKGTMAGQFLAISNHLLFMFQTQTNSYRAAFLPDGILCSNYHPVVLLTLEPSKVQATKDSAYAWDPGNAIQLASYSPHSHPSQPIFLMEATVKILPTRPCCSSYHLHAGSAFLVYPPPWHSEFLFLTISE